jgi:hypothetical protein
VRHGEEVVAPEPEEARPTTRDRHQRQRGVR